MLLVPRCPIVAPAAPEHGLFLDGDGDPDDDPVAHQGQEVGEDRFQAVAADERAHGVDDDADGVPHEARDPFRDRSQDLDVDSAYVRWGYGVGD